MKVFRIYFTESLTHRQGITDVVAKTKSDAIWFGISYGFIDKVEEIKVVI